MKIENLQSEKKENRSRISARVSWEDRNRSDLEVFFETEGEFERDLWCSPNAFFIAAAVAAMHHGEKRILIDGELCPQLKDGVLTALGWLKHWYDWYKASPSVITVEAKMQRSSPYQGKPRRAATFFSGGIDALASVRWNRLHYPEEHPLSFKDGILVYGLEIYKPEVFEYVRKSLQGLAWETGLTLIPVYTNIRYLDEDWTFWENEFMGAVFASIAHALVSRFSRVSITSSDVIRDLHPYGSHPLLDPNYSSSDLQIHHELITLSRYERTKLIAGWNPALQSLRVCNRIEAYRPDMLNCGKCEKCIRTMLALLACGVLDKTGAFPVNNINKELVTSMESLSGPICPYYSELVEKMMEIQRPDLARAIEQKIEEYHQKERKKGLRNKFIEPLIAYDKKKLGGALRKLKRMVYPGGLWT